MSNRYNHAAFGAGIGLGVYAITKVIIREPMTFKGAILSAAGGASVALLPDIIEPATNPNHRGVAHSVLALGGITYANYKIQFSPTVSKEIKEVVIVLSSGYLSHLYLDAKTPKGLPLTGI